MTDRTLHCFTDVDASPDPGFYVEFMTRAGAVDDVQLVRRMAIAAMGPVEGARILDLGCGPGDAAADIAALVGPGGSVLGVDYSDAMVAAATARFERDGLPLRFEPGDAQKLRHDDATFDVCRAERMLCHVPDATAAIAEMVRVTRPGGRVVVIDADIDLIMLDPLEPLLFRRALDAVIESMANPRIGRSLRRRMRAAGLTDVTEECCMVRMPLSLARLVVAPHLEAMVAGGSLSPEDHRRFWAEAEEADATGDFSSRTGFFVVAGTRPAD